MPEGFFSSVAIIAMLWYWWDASGAKQRAVAVGQRACAERSLQFLDESVMRSRFWLKRGADGMPRFWRRFEFEFSTDGGDRYDGFVVMVGNEVTNVHLDPYPMTEEL